jgi:NADH:ubiquinone oxidoreductase subunit F (NADH-binding)
LVGAEKKGRLDDEDLNLLEGVIEDIKGKCFCPLGESAQMAVGAFLKKYVNYSQIHRL